MSKKRTLAAALLAMLALGAVHSDARALEKGQGAPEIALKDLAGKPVKLSELKGKVVLVDFWASWCGPCRESMPFLERLNKTYKEKGLVVLGVNIDNDPESALQFLKNVPVSFSVVNDAQKQVAKSYAPPTMPSSFVIDRNGRIQAIHAGFKLSDAATVEAEIKALL